jgi:urocanate hydratase
MDSIDTATALQISRELGSMDARIDNIEKTVSEIKDSQKTMATQIGTLVETQAGTAGGKKALAAWGGGGVTVGGLLMAAAQLFADGRHPAPTQVVQAPQERPAVVQPQAQANVDPTVNTPVQF